MDYYQKLLSYSLNALGRRALTEHEMREKLLKRVRKLKGGEEEIPGVLGRLAELKLIDDGIYVRNFIRTHSALNPSGKFGIYRKLRLKGVDQDLFEEIWEEVSPDEEGLMEVAVEAFVRKKGAIDSGKQKERLMRYLAGRGFRGDMIYRAVKELGAGEK